MSATTPVQNQQVVYPSTIPAKVDPPFVNVKKFAAYTDLEQQMFYALRQGLLSLMPKIDKQGNITTQDGGTFEDIAVGQAELFAATVVDSWPTALKTYQIADTSAQDIISGAVKTTGG
jgi:hypothetical protein